MKTKGILSLISVSFVNTQYSFSFHLVLINKYCLNLLVIIFLLVLVNYNILGCRCRGYSAGGARGGGVHGLRRREETQGRQVVSGLPGVLLRVSLQQARGAELGEEAQGRVQTHVTAVW